MFRLGLDQNLKLKVAKFILQNFALRRNSGAISAFGFLITIKSHFRDGINSKT